MYHLVCEGNVWISVSNFDWLRRRAIKDAKSLGCRFTIVDDYGAALFDTAKQEIN